MIERTHVREGVECWAMQGELSLICGMRVVPRQAGVAIGESFQPRAHNSGHEGRCVASSVSPLRKVSRDLLHPGLLLRFEHFTHFAMQLSSRVWQIYCCAPPVIVVREYERTLWVVAKLNQIRFNYLQILA
jgi:hypothetical protein